eukprot:8584832-Pyramimonas_sp.AAC.1
MAAYLRLGNIERVLLLRTPAKNPPLGPRPGEIARATCAICGARDAGRPRCLDAQEVFCERGLIESRLEKRL